MIKPEDFKKAKAIIESVEMHEAALIKYTNLANNLLKCNCRVVLDLIVDGVYKLDPIPKEEIFDNDGFIKKEFGGQGLSPDKQFIFNPINYNSEKKEILENYNIGMSETEALFVVNGIVNFIKFNLDSLRQQGIKIGLDYEV